MFRGKASFIQGEDRAGEHKAQVENAARPFKHTVTKFLFVSLLFSVSLPA